MLEVEDGTKHVILVGGLRTGGPDSSILVTLLSGPFIGLRQFVGQLAKRFGSSDTRQPLVCSTIPPLPCDDGAVVNTIMQQSFSPRFSP